MSINSLKKKKSLNASLLALDQTKAKPPSFLDGSINRKEDINDNPNFIKNTT